MGMGNKRKESVHSVRLVQSENFAPFKEDAHFCYCAYVLRISRYSGFVWVVPTNTGIFLRGLKLCRKSRTLQVLLVSRKKIWGNYAFFRDNKASIWKKTAIHCFVFYCFFTIIVALKKCEVTPNFLLDFNSPCYNLLSSHSQKNHRKIFHY